MSEDANRIRRRFRLQRALFLVLFLGAIGLLAWLGDRHVREFDWTYGGRNSLSAESLRLVERIREPIRIVAWAREDEALRERIRDLVGRYRRANPRISLRFMNPDLAPEEARAEGVEFDGELRIHLGGRSERVTQLTEQAVTSALQRLLRAGETVVVFLTGHGERDPLGQANHDLGSFGQVLRKNGIQLQTLNLAVEPDIPRNTDLLVIASPRAGLLPGEVERIRKYVRHGGNLLWFTEPQQPAGLLSLAEDLGLEFLPGRVVDAMTAIFGIDSPEIVLVPRYPVHPITRDLELMTLFPGVQAMRHEADAGEASGQDKQAKDETDGDDWEVTAFLRTLDRAWTETGPLQGEIRFDPGTDEVAGPLDFGFAFSRPRPATEETDADRAGGDGEDESAEADAGTQRLVVIGDGDFLANQYLGNGGNRDLGLNIVNWLVHADALISVTPRPAPDQVLDLSQTAQTTIAVFFLFVLPGGLIFAGLWIWWRRRKR